jgi:hypothetical protein
MWNTKPDYTLLKYVRDAYRKFTNNRKVKKMKGHTNETRHLHWIPLRAGVSSSDSPVPLGPTTSKAANIPSHADKIAEGMNVVELRFLADADGRSCTAHVYMARKNDDPCLICDVAITAGQMVATDGRYYADTFAVTSLWFVDKDVKTADASGGNRMARLAFDALGYDKLFVLFDISSGIWGVDISGL